MFIGEITTKQNLGQFYVWKELHNNIFLRADENLIYISIETGPKIGGGGKWVKFDELQNKLCELINGKSVESLEIKVDRMEKALKTIVAWDSFPEVQDEGKPCSYSFLYGSRGERDYMRQIAKKALEPIEDNND